MLCAVTSLFCFTHQQVFSLVYFMIHVEPFFFELSGLLRGASYYTRVLPKVMSNFFLHANWEQQTKESAVVDGTSCCVILECLVTLIACIT